MHRAYLIRFIDFLLQNFQTGWAEVHAGRHVLHQRAHRRATEGTFVSPGIVLDLEEHAAAKGLLAFAEFFHFLALYDLIL